MADDTAMGVGDLAHKSSDGKPLTLKKSQQSLKEKALEEAGTLKIRDVDTGKEFIMRKSEASALLQQQHSGRKIVKDAATGTKLSVNEFGAQAGLPSNAPRVVVLVTRTRNVILEEYVVTLEEKERKRDDP